MFKSAKHKSNILKELETIQTKLSELNIAFGWSELQYSADKHYIRFTGTASILDTDKEI